MVCERRQAPVARDTVKLRTPVRGKVWRLALRDAHLLDLFDGGIKAVTHEVRVVGDGRHDHVQNESVPVEEVADKLELQAVARARLNQARNYVHAARAHTTRQVHTRHIVR